MIDRMDARETAQRLVKFYEERAKDPKMVWGIPWPYPSLNAATGGIQFEPRPELTVLMAPSNVGKTAFAAKVAKHTAEWVQANQPGKVIRAVLLEGGRDVFQDRMAHMIANTSRKRFMSGRASAEEWERYREAQRVLFRLPIEYMDVDQDDVSLGAIEQFIKRDRSCAWWCLDHIGLIPGYADSNANMVNISKAVMRLTRRTAPSMILTHTQRAGGKQQANGKEPVDRRPTMESVAGSIQVVKDADLLIALYREDMYKQLPDDVAHQPLRAGELLILKQRNGDRGTIHMVYNTSRTDWAEHESANGFWLAQLKETA